MRFLTVTIFKATAEHTSLNFPQIRWYGFIPNRPCALPHPTPRQLMQRQPALATRACHWCSTFHDAVTATSADVLRKPFPERRELVTRKYITDALPNNAFDIIKYIATNKLLSPATDLPLSREHLPEQLAANDAVATAWATLKDDLSEIGTQRLPRFGVVYDILSKRNLAVSTEL